MSHIVCLIMMAALITVSGVNAVTATQPVDKPEYKESAKGFLMKTIKFDGKDIRYVVYVPPTYDPKKPNPTIIFLHGAGECGTDGLRHLPVGLGVCVEFNVDKWPFIILMPQKQYAKEEWEPNAWEDHDAMIMAMLKQTQSELNVDNSRLYLTGLSQGGHGTWAIAAKHPELFAAIAPICGWADKYIAEKLVKMPIRIFHGEDDGIVPAERSKEMAEWLKAAGNTSHQLMMYPGVGHGSWDKAYYEENLPEWFLQHRR